MNPHPELTALSSELFNSAVLSAEAVKPELEKKFGLNSNAFQVKYVCIVYEFLFFFFHTMNRVTFKTLNTERRNALYDFIAETTVDTTIETFWGHVPNDLKERMKVELAENLAKAELEYSECKEFFVDPKDDVNMLEVIAAGQLIKPFKGMVNSLAYHVMKQMDDILNALTQLKIIDIAFKNSKNNTYWENLILKADKELLSL